MKKNILASVFGVFFVACAPVVLAPVSAPLTSTPAPCPPTAQPCTSTANCPESIPIDGVAKKTVCVVTKTGNFCLPRCDSATVCDHFLSGATCKNLSSVDGAYTLDFCAK